MNADAAAKVAHAVERQLATFREDLNREFLRELRTELRTQLRVELMAELGEKIKDMGGPSSAPDARALRDTAEAARMLGETVVALTARVKQLESDVAAAATVAVQAHKGRLTPKLMDTLTEELGDYVRRCIREGGLGRYVGVFQPGQRYERGQFATHAGGIWHANESTTEHPGSGSEAWTLAVKSGQHRN